MQRAEDEVAGGGRLHRDPSCFLVTDLADEDDVGVAAQDRAQPARKGEAGGRVDLDLADAGHLVLDRVLDRDEDALRLVEQVERGIERRGLAAAGRADGDDRAVGARDRPPDDRLGRRIHAQLADRERALDAALEDPQHGLLTEGGRQHRHAEVHRLAADLDPDAPVLRHPPLGDVEAAHDLQAGEHRRLHRGRCLAQLTGHPVDADPNDEPVGLGNEVDVRGAMAERPADHVVDEPDRGRLVVQDDDLVLVVVRLPGGARERLHGTDLRVVGTADRPFDLVAVGDDEAGVGPERQAQVVVCDHVRGVGDRDHRRSALDPHRQRLVALGQALGQQRHRRGVERRLAEVDEVEPVLLGQRLREVTRGDQAEADQHLAERQPTALLLCQRLLQSFGGQLPLAHQEAAEEGASLGPRVGALLGQRLDCHGSSIGARALAH